MDWQDELRRLDKELSEGEISAQEYRRMRDELLAEASAPAQGRGSLWSAARPEVTPEPAPPPPAMSAPPAAPARPPAAPPVPAAPVSVPLPAQTSPDAEDTQVVADTTVVVEENVAQGKASPVGQTGSQNAAHNEPTIAPVSHALAPSDDPDRTATVEADTVQTADSARQAAQQQAAQQQAAQQAAQQQAAQQQAAQQQAAGQAAAQQPAERTEDPHDEKVPTFPPRPADRPIPQAPPLPAPAPWTGQVLGEEVFADAKPYSNTRRAATMALSIIVALAVVGGVVWYLAFRNDDAPAAQSSQDPPASQQPQSQPSSQPPPSQPPSADVPSNLGDAVAPLPGVADKNSGTITAARAGQLKQIAPLEVKAANDNGVTDVIFRGSTHGTFGNALLVFTTPDAKSASNLAAAETKYLKDTGFTEGEQLRDGIPVLEWTGGGATVYRVVYTTGKYTVRFGVAQRDANPDDLRKELEAVADTILAVLPG